MLVFLGMSHQSGRRHMQFLSCISGILTNCIIDLHVGVPIPR